MMVCLIKDPVIREDTVVELLKSSPVPGISQP